MLYQFYQAMTDLTEPMRMFAAAGLKSRPDAGRVRPGADGQ